MQKSPTATNFIDYNVLYDNDFDQEANCNCAGTPAADSDNDGICDANDNTNGNCTLNATCDDGDACTTGETYDVNCNCSGGILAGNNSSDSLNTTDDTFIRGGSYAGNNFGLIYKI